MLYTKEKKQLDEWGGQVQHYGYKCDWTISLT